ncbi:MAG: hypothetical protein GVY29_02380 [Spirochaetes bacterium]|nr:hypothetical protein [Spirochaetota bacterium]
MKRKSSFVNSTMPCYPNAVIASVVLPYWPILAALPLALVQWIAAGRSLRRLEYVFKPLTMIVLITAVVYFFPQVASPWQRAWFVGAFVLSLAGDVFLMFKRDGSFRAGLFSFLLAQVLFIIGFNESLPPEGSYVLLIPVGAVGLVLYVVLVLRIVQGGRKGMILPVTLYSVALSIMAFSALTTTVRSDWGTLRAGISAAGGLLFFVSDGVLALNKFAFPVPGSAVVVHLTYHVAQVLLALSLFPV